MLAMGKNIIHISEAEAASDLATVLARVRAGAEIVIGGHEPVVVVRAGEVRAEPERGRFLSECIALAKAHEEETGKAPVLDPDFAADVEEIVRNRKSWNPPAWE
jgi:antitoxin (DNA-binding transcriptional repressor) of toxin-antitoxin stability system